MSQFVIYIQLEKYLAQWAEHHFGSPIVFPPQSNENAVIRTFISRLPPGKMPDLNDGTLTAVAIPDSKAKPPSVFNYMGPRGKRAVKEAIKDLFRRSLWTDISPLENCSVGLNSRIAAWCEMHGIDIDRVETVRQLYYRTRDAYNDSGVNLRNCSRKKSDK